MAAGEATEIVINRGELFPEETFLAFSGSLSWSDGSPVKGASLRFRAVEGTAVERGASSFSVKTDAGGKFKGAGLQPGGWRLRASSREGWSVNLPDLSLPDHPGTVTPINLVISSGSLSGTICSSATGLPISHSNVCLVSLLEAGTNRAVSTCRKLPGIDRFRLIGVPQGDYRYQINVDGFDYFQSETIFVAEGSDLLLGKVLLEPCGVVDLEVVDLSGHPIKSYRVVCVETGRPAAPVRSLPGGKRRFDKLPFGLVGISLNAGGFREKTIALSIERGKPTEARIVLDPE